MSEGLRPEARATVAVLAQSGMEIHLLSGDRDAAVQQMARAAGIAHVQGECSPEDKLDALRALQAQGRHVAMVGDGLNDDLGLIAQTTLLARKTLRIVRQNLIWAAGYNALSIPLAVMGWMPAWLAGLGMALSSLLVVLNAARLTRQLPVLHTSDAAAESAQRAVTAPAAPPLLGVR